MYEIQRKAAEEELFGERWFIPTTFARFFGKRSRLLRSDLRLLRHRRLLADESHPGMGTPYLPECYASVASECTHLIWFA
jgi:hypothetical protein